VSFPARTEPGPGARGRPRGRAAGQVLGIRADRHTLDDRQDTVPRVDRTGIPRRHLPCDFPPWRSVYGYLAADALRPLPALPVTAAVHDVWLRA
jgi:hypothetical protein